MFKDVQNRHVLFLKELKRETFKFIKTLTNPFLHVSLFIHLCIYFNSEVPSL